MFDIPEERVEIAANILRDHLDFEGKKSEADWQEAAQWVLDYAHEELRFEIRAAKREALARAASVVEPSAHSWLGRWYGAPTILRAIRSLT
jgi:hypothetical protein